VGIRIRPLACTVFFLVSAFLIPHPPPASAHRGDPVQTDAKLKRKQHRHFNFWSQYKLNENDYFVVFRELSAVRKQIGRDFDTFPEERVDVILTDQDVFYDYTGMPEFVGGLYDGKIHLPAIYKLKSKDHLRALLWHEYTHAVIHSRTQGRCPPWLNEGFAEYEEARIIKDNLEYLPQILMEGKLPYTWEQLEAVFSARHMVTPLHLYVGYVQSHAVARYLFWRYGTQKIGKLLDNIEGPGGFKKAVEKVLRTDMESLEQEVILFLKRME